MVAAYTVASKVTRVRRCRRKCMLAPGLADVLEPIVVGDAPTHPVKILRNKRMVIARQGDPGCILDPFVTGVCSQSEADAPPDGTSFGLHKVKQVAYDDIGARNSPDCRHH